MAKLGLTWAKGLRIYLTGGGERKVNLMFQKFVDNKNLSKEIFHFKKFWQRKQKKKLRRVNPREEIKLSPQKIVGLKTFCII